MADSIIRTDQITVVNSSDFQNTDTIFVLINGSLRRMSKLEFIRLLNNSVKGEKGDQGLTGNRGERGAKGDQGLRGEKGLQGDQGLTGEKGDSISGWSPVLTSVVNGRNVYLYLADWVGGVDLENKPTLTGYLSPTGIVQSIFDGATPVNTDYTEKFNEMDSEIASNRERIQSAEDSLENKLDSGSTTDSIPEGSALYFSQARVRDTVLTTLTTASDAPITQSDTVVQALGKLQAQEDLKVAEADLQDGVRSTTLENLVKSDSVIGENDTVISALGKAQGQIDNVPQKVRESILVDLSVMDNTPITPTTSVIQGFGRLQAQIDDVPNRVRDVDLTGLITSNTSQVVSSDKLIIALGKLQGQVNQLRQTIESLDTRLVALESQTP